MAATIPLVSHAPVAGRPPRAPCTLTFVCCSARALASWMGTAAQRLMRGWMWRCQHLSIGLVLLLVPLLFVALHVPPRPVWCAVSFQKGEPKAKSCRERGGFPRGRPLHFPSFSEDDGASASCRSLCHSCLPCSCRHRGNRRGLSGMQRSHGAQRLPAQDCQSSTRAHQARSLGGIAFCRPAVCYQCGTWAWPCAADRRPSEPAVGSRPSPHCRLWAGCWVCQGLQGRF